MSATPRPPHNETEGGLCRAVRHYKWLARFNNWLLWFVYFVAIAASVFSTLATATSRLQPGVLGAVIAALPGAAVLLNNTFRFDAHWLWHREKRARLEALLRLSRAGAPSTSAAEVAESWNRIELEMEHTRPGLGKLPTPPTTESP